MNHECQGNKREVAVWKDGDVEVEDHGCLMLSGYFDFGGVSQGFGYVIDDTFLKNFIGVFNGGRLRNCNNKTVWVTHCWDRIHKVEPILKEDGKAFDVDKWSQDLQKLAKAGV